MWPEALGDCLGSGGFAAVWAIELGSDLGADRVLKLAHANHELGRARMLREAEAMVAIGAPAVPRVFDSGVTANGRAWIIMQRIIGTTLADLTMNGPCRPG